MRPFRRRSRALAEIVGTLMLVVIVVAAATAFSFFVASYQKQVQAEEMAAHDKNLEKLRILDLVPTVTLHSAPRLVSLRIEIASLDVNPIAVYGIDVNDTPVVAYNVTNSIGTPLGPPGCFNGGALTSNTSCFLDVPPEAQIFLSLDLNSSAATFAFGAASATFTENSLFSFDIFTLLGNEFSQSFVPPVAIAQLTFVVSGGASLPVLDGSGSYQPVSGADKNVTVDRWMWSVGASAGTCNPTAICGSYSGEEVELGSAFNSTIPWTCQIQLTVTNSDSLIDSTTIEFAV